MSRNGLHPIVAQQQTQRNQHPKASIKNRQLKAEQRQRPASPVTAEDEGKRAAGQLRRDYNFRRRVWTPLAQAIGRPATAGQ